MKKIRQIFIFIYSMMFSWIYAQSCPTITAVDQFGSSEPLINCDYPLLNSQNCLNLTVQFPQIRATDSYSVSSILYQPVIPFDQGTPLNANFDDVFPEKITLPFQFCFYGNTYNEVVVGSNGLITFDVSQLGNISYPNIQADNPSPLLPINSVFGVLHDMVFSSSEESEIYYSVIGSAPCRKFVVNFYKGRQSGCPDIYSTSQIVLYEGTNTIEVFVEDKPSPCSTAKFKESLIGIMNATGSQGISPVGRNTGVWGTQNEAYRFSPEGSIIQPSFQWLDSEEKIIGTTQAIQVCPQGNSTYTVRVSYPTCGAQSFILTDDIEMKFAPDFPLAKKHTEYFCTASGNIQNINLGDYAAEITPQNPSDFIITFHNSLSDANSGANPLPNEQAISANAVFYVRIENPTDPTCFRTALLEFKFVSQALLTNTVLICDQNSDGVENDFTLALLDEQLVSSGLSGDIVYFLSQIDAQNNINSVTSAEITTDTQFWIRLIIGDCSEIIGPVFVNLQPGPEINTPINFDIEICDIKNDGSEAYSFTNINELISTDPTLIFEYYDTYQKAYEGIADPIFMINEGEYSIYARVEIPGGCFSIAEVKLNVVFTKVEANNKSVYLCFNGTDDLTFNLNELSQEMLINPLTGIDIAFYPDYYKAVDGGTHLQITPIQTITDDGNFVSKTFWVRFTNADGCYTIRELTVILVYPAPLKNTVDVCDFYNDGSESILLANYSSELIGAQNAIAKYFANEGDAIANTNPITTPVLINSSTVYFVRIEAYGCSSVYPVTFSLVPVPTVEAQIQVHQTNVCDNNADGTEFFDLTTLQPQIYAGTSPVNFSYFLNYNSTTHTFSNRVSNPQQFPIGSNSTVYVKIQFVTGLCFSASTVNITNDFLPPILLNQDAVLEKCDYDFNLFESFHLPDAIPQIFDASANTLLLSDITVSYYKSQLEANEGNPPNQISDTQITEFSNVIVWARFQSNLYGCYSVAPIELNTYLPPKAIASEITVCDENFDSHYEVNLYHYTSSMVDIVNPQYIFIFYLTENNAENGTNPISDPENFTMNTFPQKIWVRVEIIPGCYDVGVIEFIQGQTLILDHDGPFDLNDVCDSGNDRIETINLTQFENQILGSGANFEYYPSLTDIRNDTNLISNPFNYEFHAENGNEIYIKVKKGVDCSAFVKIVVNLKTSPEFILPDYYYCPYNDGVVDITPDFSGLDIGSFEWKDPNGIIVSTTSELLGVNISGEYTLSVIGINGCPFSTTFDVLAYEVPVITELIPNGNSYTVIATGSKPIEYSIDGEHWQSSNVFHNLSPGVITFYVRFRDEECLGLVKEGLTLNIQNVFTPNADGINDIWSIGDLWVFDGQPAKIQIFDRLGTKVFEQQSATKLEWSGFFGGRKLPTASYWYMLSLPDGRNFKGWILLKNRN